MKEIAVKNFSNINPKPCPLELEFKNKGNKNDNLIAGWTKYWNEVLSPETSLDPNLVKALIASESSFEPNVLANKKNSNSARGLTQITNDTRKILGDEKGELIGNVLNHKIVSYFVMDITTLLMKMIL